MQSRPQRLFAKKTPWVGVTITIATTSTNRFIERTISREKKHESERRDGAEQS